MAFAAPIRTALLRMPISPARRTADLLSSGLSPGQLRGPRWQQALHGVRAAAGVDLHDPGERILAAAATLRPGCAIGGWAAAYLQGCAALDGRGPTGRVELAVPIVCPPPTQARCRPGVLVLRSALPSSDIERRHGVPLTTATRTAFDLARGAFDERPRLREAVVALDALCRPPGPALATVVDQVERHRRWRGVPMARAALALADPRAKSPGETRMRLLWMLDARLSRPEVNVEVVDRGGWPLGEVDLLGAAVGLVGEYDGSGHRELLAHTADNSREEGLEDGGLVVVRLSGPDLWPSNVRRSVFRLRRGWARAARTDPAAHQWTWRRPARG